MCCMRNPDCNEFSLELATAYRLLSGTVQSRRAALQRHQWKTRLMYVIYSVSLRDQGIYLKILKLIFISYAVTNSKISIFASVRLRDRSAGIIGAGFLLFLINTSWQQFYYTGLRFSILLPPDWSTKNLCFPCLWNFCWILLLFYSLSLSKLYLSVSFHPYMWDSIIDNGDGEKAFRSQG